MIHTVIIEDERDAVSLLSGIINEYCPSLLIVGVAGNIPDGLKLIEDVKPNLVFLDIEIEGGTSFQLLDRLKHVSFKIIFTTAYDQYALKAFKYGAIDYLLKPYSPKDVVRSIERVKKTQYDQTIFNRLDYLIKQNKPSQNIKINIPTSEGMNIVSVSNIIRIEAYRSYCFAYLSDGDRILVSKPLKDLEAMLPDYMFFRVHSAHLINMDYVKKYIKEDGGSIVMNDGCHIPIARRRKSEFLAILSR